MQFIKVIIFAVLVSISGFSFADGLQSNGPQFGLYATKYFGAKSHVPVLYSMQMDYNLRNGNLNNGIEISTRPALLDLQFTRYGVVDFRASGVSALQPKYFLGSGEEGFFSFIDWSIVGLAAVGVGVLYIAEQDKEDRKDRIAEADAAASGGGEEPAAEGDNGGGEPALGCDPALGSGQCI